MNCTCFITVATEDDAELLIMNSSYKVGPDTEDSRVSFKSDDPSNQPSVYDNTLPVAECDINIKQGSDNEDVKMKIEEHDITTLSIQGTVKLEQEGCHEGHRKPVISTYDCDINIKQEIDDAENVKVVCDVESYDRSDCDQRINRNHCINKHNNAEHRATDQWHHCQVCNYRTRNKSDLKRHFIAKHDEEAEWYGCRACNFTTRIKSELGRHVRERHDDNSKWYNCRACDFKTKRNKTLTQHVRDIHLEKAEVLQCALCKYQTKSERYLRNHVNRTHLEDVKWYQCRFCDFRAKSSGILKGHFTAKHDEEAEWYQCHNCDLKTKNKGTLRRHLQRQHRLQWRLVTFMSRGATS